MSVRIEKSKKKLVLLLQAGLAIVFLTQCSAPDKNETSTASGSNMKSYLPNVTYRQRDQKYVYSTPGYNPNTATLNEETGVWTDDQGKLFAEVCEDLGAGESNSFGQNSNGATCIYVDPYEISKIPLERSREHIYREKDRKAILENDHYSPSENWRYE